MENVAITGVSGYLGTQILKLLDKDPDVKTVVGMDVRPPNFSTSKLKFISMDVRKPMADIFAQNKVDSAFHLAFVLPPKMGVDAHEINISGSQSFLNACEASSAEALFYQSSHTVYGAWADNPKVITEDQPLRPTPKFPYGQDKAEVEMMFQEYAKKPPRAERHHCPGGVGGGTRGRPFRSQRPLHARHHTRLRLRSRLAVHIRGRPGPAGRDPGEGAAVRHLQRGCRGGGPLQPDAEVDRQSRLLACRPRSGER